MDSRELKKILAGISLAGLIAAGSGSLLGCATSCGKSSCAGGKDKSQAGQSEKARTSCSGGQKPPSGKPGGIPCGGGTSCA